MKKAARPKPKAKQGRGVAKSKTAETAAAEPPMGLAAIGRLAAGAIGSVLSLVMPRPKTRAARKADAVKPAAEKPVSPAPTKRRKRPARTVTLTR